MSSNFYVGEPNPNQAGSGNNIVEGTFDVNFKDNLNNNNVYTFYYHAVTNEICYLYLPKGGLGFNSPADSSIITSEPIVGGMPPAIKPTRQLTVLMPYATINDDNTPNVNPNIGYMLINDDDTISLTSTFGLVPEFKTGEALATDQEGGLSFFYSLLP